MFEQQAQELGDVDGLEVLLTKLDIQPHAGSPGSDGQGRNRRNPVVLVVVPNDRGPAFGTPGPTTCRDEHEAAFIHEDDVGSKPSGFFLGQATCASSNV